MINIHKGALKFIIFIGILFFLAYLGKFFHLDATAIENTLKKFPLLYSGMIFIVLYCLVTFFFWFSKDILRLTAAFLYGAGLSTLFIWIAETANTFILFYLARFLGRAFVEKSLETNLKQLDIKVARLNFFWLFLFRFVPLVPFRFLDLAAGLTAIPFRRYLLAVLFGSPLRIFWVQYILAGVGRSIFSNPLAFSGYLMQHKILLWGSLFYLILVGIVAGKIRQKD